MAADSACQPRQRRKYARENVIVGIERYPHDETLRREYLDRSLGSIRRLALSDAHRHKDILLNSRLLLRLLWLQPVGQLALAVLPEPVPEHLFRKVFLLTEFLLGLPTVAKALEGAHPELLLVHIPTTSTYRHLYSSSVEKHCPSAINLSEDAVHRTDTNIPAKRLIIAKPKL